MVSVSSYEDTFRSAFNKSVEDLPDDFTDLIKSIEDKIFESVQDKLRDSTVYYLKDNIQDDICRHAAEVAESMLRNALTGNDTALRNLFGFNDWYMKHFYTGEQPTGFKLLDTLVERNPKLFDQEKIKQLEIERDAYKKELERIKKYYNERYED